MERERGRMPSPSISILSFPFVVCPSSGHPWNVISLSLAVSVAVQVMEITRFRNFGNRSGDFCTILVMRLVLCALQID